MNHSVSSWRGFCSPALFAPIDAASLVIFRIAFGLILFWEVTRYLSKGWVAQYYIEPNLLFPYLGFYWVEPVSPAGMFWIFFALGVFSLAIAAGLWYRFSLLAFGVLFTFVFLLDRARFLNHLYLVCILSLLLILIPAHGRYSLDALRRPQKAFSPLLGWHLWLLRGQFFVLYFYGAVAKMNYDWFFLGEPMRNYMGFTVQNPVPGQELLVYFFAVNGFLFDLLIVPALLWRKTRLPAFAAAAFFHLSNAYLFYIGIFPWFALVATTIFFEPDWPRRFWALCRKRAYAPLALPAAAIPPLARRYVAAFLVVWFSIHAVIPLRHLAYPGSVMWTEEGGRFAWHMKRNLKHTEMRWFATDPATDTTWEIAADRSLLRHQMWYFQIYPDMFLDFSRFVQQKMAAEGIPDVEVRAVVRSSLNLRPHRLQVDPAADLTEASWTLRPHAWLLH